jgi:type III restriction enzyme
MLGKITDINDFRNTYVAHQEKELTDGKLAEKNLRKWIDVLSTLSGI